jgi:hypothetical protein
MDTWVGTILVAVGLALIGFSFGYIAQRYLHLRWELPKARRMHYEGLVDIIAAIGCFFCLTGWGMLTSELYPATDSAMDWLFLVVLVVSFFWVCAGLKRLDDAKKELRKNGQSS